MANHIAFHICRKAYAVALALGTPVLRHHQRKRIKLGKENAQRILEREGVSSIPRPHGRVIWFHGASVGEALATLPVIEQILAECEDTWALLTTGTVTSAEIVKPRLPDHTIHQFVPLDRAAWIAAFLDHWQPCAAVWVESEFWPNTLWGIRERDIPLILLNGRVSERSFRRWQRVPAFVRGMLACFDLCLAQSEEDSTRLQQLGARNVHNTGNIKLGAAPLPYDSVQLDQLAMVTKGRPVWLMSSTHPGEDRIAAEVHNALIRDIPNLLTILVPRHPDRGKAIADMLVSQNLIVAQRSGNQPITADVQIYIADTIGELGIFYRLCQVVFMGKSLISPGGGQNPYEAARIGCSVIFGPYMSNFAELSDSMVEHGAAKQVSDVRDLESEIRQQLLAPEIVNQNIEAADTFCAQHATTVDDSVQEILQMIPRSNLPHR